MTYQIRSYALDVGRRNKHLHAVVSDPRDGIGASVNYFSDIFQHSIHHLCPLILIERHLPEPLEIWDAAAEVRIFESHFDDCIRIAIAEMKAKPAGQSHLEIHLGRKNAVNVRVFDNTADAEKWLYA